MTISIPRTSNRILILSALPLERIEICAFLESTRELEYDGRTYYEGVFEEYTVVVGETGMRNSQAAIVTASALSKFTPKFAIFIGVAGGLKDVEIGDVVFASFVSNYASGKETVGSTAGTSCQSEFKARPCDRYPPSSLLKLAEKITNDKKWQARIANAAQTSPKAYIGRICSGDVLVADANAHTVKNITDHYNDALALEMEGAGFMGAAYEKSYEAVVVRGISDMLSKSAETDGKQQPIAANHASAFVFELISAWLSKQSLEKTEPVVAETAEESKPMEAKESSIGKEGPINPMVPGDLVSEKRETQTTTDDVQKNTAKEIDVDKTSAAVTRFWHMPGNGSGTCVELIVRVVSKGSGANEAECEALGLSYGRSIRRSIDIVEPSELCGKYAFTKILYADYNNAGWFYDLTQSEPIKLMARLEWGFGTRRIYPTVEEKLNAMEQRKPEPSVKMVKEEIHGLIFVKFYPDG